MTDIVYVENFCYCLLVKYIRLFLYCHCGFLEFILQKLLCSASDWSCWVHSVQRPYDVGSASLVLVANICKTATTTRLQYRPGISRLLKIEIGVSFVHHAQKHKLSIFDAAYMFDVKEIQSILCKRCSTTGRMLWTTTPSYGKQRSLDPRNLKSPDLDSWNFVNLSRLSNSLNLPSFVDIRPPPGAAQHIRAFSMYRDDSAYLLFSCTRGSQVTPAPSIFMHHGLYDAVVWREMHLGSQRLQTSCGAHLSRKPLTFGTFRGCAVCIPVIWTLIVSYR